MPQPLFSIIVPVYKDLYFKECIDSILVQTFTDFELIIINDVSPFPIDEIIKQYDDPHIQYHINEKRFGAVNLVENWNQALNYAKGEYLLCMGDDDRLLPKCLEEYHKLIAMHPDSDLFHARAQIINESGKIIDLQFNRPEHESVYAMIWHHLKGRRQYIGDYLFKTSTLKQNGGFFNTPCAWASDDISSFIAAKEKGVVNSNEFGFQYRMSSCSISSSNFAYEKSKAHLIALEWYKHFLEAMPENEKDRIYRDLIKKNISNFIYSRIYEKQIMADLQHHPIRLFRWMKKRKEFSLSIRRLLGIWHMALRNKGFWI